MVSGMVILHAFPDAAHHQQPLVGSPDQGGNH